jgi:hypothetical protein
VHGKCISCHTPDTTLADAEIPVCFSCWKSQKVRPGLIKRLAKKRAERIAATTKEPPDD